MLKLNVLILILCYNIIFIEKCFGEVKEGTEAGYIITNKIYWRGDNLLKGSNYCTNLTVNTNAGGEIVFVDPDKFSIKGVTNFYLIKLKNWGNAVDKYNLFVLSTNYSSSPPASNWIAGFKFGDSVTMSITVTNYKTNSFYFFIYAKENALPGS